MIKPGEADEWSELMKIEELNPWMMTKLKESYHQARQEDDQWKSIVPQILRKSTDFLRRIISRRVGERVALTYVCLRCHRFPMGGYIWWVSMKREVQLGVRRAAARKLGRPRTVSLVLQDGADRREAKVFRALRPK